MTAVKRRSRYDVGPDDPVPAAAPSPLPPIAVPWESPAEANEARTLLVSARSELERLVQAELQRLEATFGQKAEHVARKLQRTRQEIERLEQETQAMRANKYDELVAKLRDRVNAL